MADVVRRVEYYYTEVPDRPGGGAKVLTALKAEGVNLIALNGFPFIVGDSSLLKGNALHSGTEHHPLTYTKRMLYSVFNGHRDDLGVPCSEGHNSLAKMGCAY